MFSPSRRTLVTNFGAVEDRDTLLVKGPRELCAADFGLPNLLSPWDRLWFSAVVKAAQLRRRQVDLRKRLFH